jgi:hypothetical protein
MNGVGNVIARATEAAKEFNVIDHFIDITEELEV